MKTNFKPWGRTIILIVSGFCLATCTNNLTPVPEGEYSTKIVGSWQGMVGNSKEKMSIKGDGTFNCQIYTMGFIANTLSEKTLPGTVFGTWKIAGKTISLRITGSENERLRNRVAISNIESFKTDELILKSDNGGTSPFRRVRAFWFNTNVN